MSNFHGRKRPFGNLSTKVNYGDEATRRLFDDEECFFGDLEFWQIKCLKEFSSISINTPKFIQGHKKLNETFKKQYPNMSVPDICCTINLDNCVSHITGYWTIAVMSAKNGGLALKICTETRGHELSKLLEDPKNDLAFHRNAYDDKSTLEKKLQELLDNAKKLNGLATAVRNKYKANSESQNSTAGSQNDVVSIFNRGCYYITSYNYNVYQGNFKLIPWYDNRYLMLPSKPDVLKSMKVNTWIQVQSSIIGTVNSSLWINDISKLSLPQKEKLIQDWVPCFNQFLHGTGVLNYGYPPQGVRYDIIENSADLRSLEDYIRYILS